MPRLFVAIDLPEPVKPPLSRLASEVSGAKLVGTGELHLTLRFIGEVDEDTCSAIKTALSAVSFTRFPMSLLGVGHFPPYGYPRVLWVGVEHRYELLLLQKDVESALQQTGIPAEERRFSPHITLARLKGTPSAMVTRFEASHRDLYFPPFEVAEFILYSSVLTPHGAVHSKEAVYRYADAPPRPSPITATR